MHVKLVHKELPVDLSDEEVAKRARELARRQMSFLRLKSDHKTAKREWRDKLKHAEGVIDDLARGIEDATEDQMVETREEYTVSNGMIVITRTDTGDQIGIRKASDEEVLAYDEELQGDMFNSEGEDQGDAAAG